jgi:hypothetical protein
MRLIGVILITIGGYSDWHLPAPGELEKVYEANIQTIIKKSK